MDFNHVEYTNDWPVWQDRGSRPLGKTVARSFLGACAGILLGMGVASAGALTGDTVNVINISPTPTNVISLGDFTVPVANILFDAGTFGASIGGNEVDIANRTNATIGFQPGATEIFKITDTTSSRILSVQMDLNSTGVTFDPTGLIFGNNFLQVDLTKVAFAPGGTLRLDVAVSDRVGGPGPLPLPSSLPLLTSGLVVLASIRFATRKGGRAA
jgi:hypothetical protein